MNLFHWIYLHYDWRWLSAPPGLIALFIILKTIYHWVRNIDMMVSFVSDVATNHLPHIYKRLSAIDNRLGELGMQKSPPMVFMPKRKR